MGKRRKRLQGPQVRLARTEVLPPLNLGFLNAATVTLPDFDLAQIILVGAGGIGAYMAQHIGRLMRVLYQSHKGVHLTIVDPDIVEEQNLGRQLFCDAEVGVPKAEALTRRYGHAWGLNVSSYVGKFDDSLILGTEVTILVGCVDNADARMTLAQTLMHNSEIQPSSIWWLDCGNLYDTGRVLLGSAYSLDQLHGAFKDKNTCLALPGPSMQWPGLLEPQPEEIGDGSMSCAQMAAANLQSLNINARIAAEAADMITRLLVTKDLKRFACEVNLAAGTVVSKYVTPEEVAGVIRRPVGFLLEEGSRQSLAAGAYL
jgi:PRTRC genetic system ThiF family protein